MDTGGAEEKLLAPGYPDPAVAEQKADEQTLISLFAVLEQQTVLQLSEIIKNVHHTEFVRQSAALAFKNAIYAKDTEMKVRMQEAWRSIPADDRRLAMKNIVEALRTDNAVLGRAVAQCVANIVLAETMHGERHELIPFLAESIINTETGSMMKRSCLEAVGYICEEINIQVVKDYSDIILSAVIHAMRKEEPSAEIRYAATTALFNSMDFFQVNFETEHERERIMTVVCETTRSGDIRLQIGVLQCLVKIMQLYYEFMRPWMKVAFFPISFQAMNAPVPEIVLQGIEFWSTVCEMEISLNLEEAQARDEGRTLPNKSYGFTMDYLQFVVPCLLQLLAQQPDGDDEEWVPSKAASVCLMLIAQCAKKEVIPPVRRFIEDNIKSPNWRFRDAACVAFGSVLEGPETECLETLAVEAYDGIVALLTDGNIAVRDSAAWVVQRMCQFVPEAALILARFDSTVDALCGSLTGPPRVAASACWALSALAQTSYGTAPGHDANIPRSSALSGCFVSVVDQLSAAAVRADSEQNNLRMAAFGALSEFMSNSPQEMYQTVWHYLTMVLGQLDAILQRQPQISKTERDHLGEYCQQLLALLQTIIQRLEREHLMQVAEYIFAVCNGILGLHQVGRSLQAEPEAFMCLCVMLEGLNVEFLPFLEHLKVHIMAALKATSYDEHALLNSTLTFIGEMCRTFEATLLLWIPEIVQSILNIIDHVTDPSCLVKPKAVQTLGDIASSLNHHFLQFSSVSIRCIMEIAVPSDPDMYLDMLDAVLDACLGIVNGITAGTSALISPYSEAIVRLITCVATEAASVPDSTILTSACLIGALCGLCGVDILPHLDKPELHALLVKGKRSNKDKTRNLSRWAWKQLKKLRNCSGNTASTLSAFHQSELEMA